MSPGKGTLEFLFLCRQSLEKSKGWGRGCGRMDEWQVRVNCKGEIAILQAQPPAQARWLPCAAGATSPEFGASSHGALLVGILPTHSPANAHKTLIRCQKLCWVGKKRLFWGVCVCARMGVTAAQASQNAQEQHCPTAI